MKYNTKTIDTINSLFAKMESLSPLKDEDRKKLEKKFRLEFNYNSNHLEGNTLSYGQTELLLFFDKVIGDVKLSDVEEMKAHDIALSEIEKRAKNEERPLTEKFIKELNKIILVRPFWKEAITLEEIPTRKKIEIGSYKKMPNSVRLRNGEIHEYASPQETPAKMNDLMNWYNSNVKSMHPAQLAIEFHYKFVCIHPFDDGNGRVARLLMNYILIKNNYPPIIIKSKDKESYLTSLQKADTGDLISMLEYIEEQLIWSLNVKLKASKGEDIEEVDDLEKEIELLKREKLSKSKIYKTPKILFEKINYIDAKLWNPLSTMLEKLDDFFAETRNDVYVDHIKFEKKITKPHPFFQFSDKEEVIKPHLIFGYNLDESEVSQIRWERKMLSLKSVEKKIDYFINCELILNEDNYILTIYESNTDSGTLFKAKKELFQEQKKYNSFLFQEDIDKINKIVTSHLVSIIKRK